MTPLLSILILVLLAYLGTILSNQYRSDNIYVQSVLYTGVGYLLIGILIGPEWLKIIKTNWLTNLEVFIGFVLGWTGFMIGLQVNVKQLKRFQGKYYLFSSINYIFTILVLIVLGLISIKLFDLGIKTRDIIAIAIIGALNSPIIVAVLKKNFRYRGPIIHFLEFNSAFDNILGVITIGILMMVFAVEKSGAEVLFNLGLILMLNFLLAWIYFYLSKNMVLSDPQTLLILMAAILILVGISQAIIFSTLFTAFIFGVIMANIPINTWKLYHSIARIEGPIYLLLLIFFGFNMVNPSWALIWATLLFISARVLVKFVSGSVLLQLNRQFKNYRIGFAGIGMGGITLGITLDYYLSYSSAYAVNVFIVIGASFILNDIISLKAAKLALKK